MSAQGLALRDTGPAKQGLPLDAVREEAEWLLDHGPRFAVWLHNDEINGFDFVVRVVRRVFGYGMARAFWLTLRAHLRGRSELWRGGEAEARKRADRVVAMGPDPLMRSRGAGPLQVSVEPLEGPG